MMKLIKILFLIIGSIFLIEFLLFVKAFFSQEKIVLNKSIHHTLPLSKKEEHELENALEQFQKKALWKTPTQGTPLFISRIYFCKNEVLVDPIEENITFNSQIPIRWLLEHNLDYTNPNILNEDPSSDGFNNLEKWQGNDPYNNPGASSSDPYDPESRPLLWTKLRCYWNDLHKSTYYFYFLDFDEDSSEATLLLEDENKGAANTKIKHLKIGEELKETQLQLIHFEKKTTINKDIFYDNSVLTLINPLSKKECSIVKKSRLHPSPTTIDTLDNITFEYTLTSPPKKITLTYGDTFSLESIPIPPGYPHAGEKSQELYQFMRVDNSKAVIQKEGHEYEIPILTSNNG